MATRRSYTPCHKTAGKNLISYDNFRIRLSDPTVEQIVSHIVDKRGFYFHGNRKHKNAWLPHDQKQAEALCLLAINIGSLITNDAAALMFAPELSERHFSDAKATGAAMSFSVTFSYRDANSGFEREGKLNISTPGTKVTPKLALYVAQQFLGRFIENDPVDDLISAKCTVSGTSQHVFNIVLFTEETDTQSEP